MFYFKVVSRTDVLSTDLELNSEESGEERSSWFLSLRECTAPLSYLSPVGMEGETSYAQPLPSITSLRVLNLSLSELYTWVSSTSHLRRAYLFRLEPVSGSVETRNGRNRLFTRR